MQAFAQVKGGDAVHVEQVSAAGALGGGDKKDRDDEENEPDPEDHRRGPVRAGQGEGGPDRRYVDDDERPKEPAALANDAQSRGDDRRGDGCLFFHNSLLRYHSIPFVLLPTGSFSLLSQDGQDVEPKVQQS